VVIGEGCAALGGRREEILRSQLGHLATVSDESTNLTVQVLPFTNGRTPWLDTGRPWAATLETNPGSGQGESHAPDLRRPG
jgi:Domain of unknown function (DUF5753)